MQKPTQSERAITRNAQGIQITKLERLLGIFDRIAVRSALVVMFCGVLYFGDYINDHYGAGSAWEYITIMAVLFLIGATILILFCIAESEQVVSATAKHSASIRRRVATWIGSNSSSVLVIVYALFVMGSLFCAPWEGWRSQYDKKWGNPRITQYGPIFSPPESLAVSPRLKSEEIILVWGALGIAAFAGVYLSKRGKAAAEK